MPGNNWRLNDSFPDSLAQEFHAPAAAWSGVVFWGLFEQAFSGVVSQDATAIIAGLALAGVALGDETVRGDSNSALAGLAFGAISLGDESTRGDANDLVTGFAVSVALSDEAVEGDANARPFGVAVGDLVLASATVTGDARAAAIGFDLPLSLGDETTYVDAVAVLAGVEINALAVGDAAVSGDSAAAVTGVATGAIATGFQGEQVIEPVVPVETKLFGGKRNFGGGIVDRIRHAKIDERRGFSIGVVLGKVRSIFAPQRNTVVSITGFSVGRASLARVDATAEDNFTDEELIALAMAA